MEAGSAKGAGGRSAPPAPLSPVLRRSLYPPSLPCLPQTGNFSLSFADMPADFGPSLPPDGITGADWGGSGATLCREQRGIVILGAALCQPLEAACKPSIALGLAITLNVLPQASCCWLTRPTPAPT